MTTLPEIVGEFVSDLVSLGAEASKSVLPGAALAGGAVSRYLRKRSQQARDILMEELRRANISDVQAASEDEAVCVIWKYIRVAQEGAARLNLRLLAKVICSQLQTGRLVADEFLQHADALASLSRDEIIVVGTMYRNWTETRDVPLATPASRTAEHDPWSRTILELSGKGLSPEHVIATVTRAQRSGLIYSASGYGVTMYEVSPQLIDLGRTVDFEDALRREAQV